MISDKVNDALNGQMKAELYSSYLYLSMSSYFHSTGMHGAASWMRVQAGEELVHSMKFFDYLAANGRAIMQPVEAPPSSWVSALDVFQNVYDHERKVTALIKGLVEVAVQENDPGTKNFLQWYVDEQVEEEESSGSVLQKAKASGSDRVALQSLDKELGQRRFKFPSGYQIFGNQGATIGSLKT